MHPFFLILLGLFQATAGAQPRDTALGGKMVRCKVGEEWREGLARFRERIPGEEDDYYLRPQPIVRRGYVRFRVLSDSGTGLIRPIGAPERVVTWTDLQCTGIEEIPPDQVCGVVENTLGHVTIVDATVGRSDLVVAAATDEDGSFCLNPGERPTYLGVSRKDGAIKVVVDASSQIDALLSGDPVRIVLPERPQHGVGLRLKDNGDGSWSVAHVIAGMPADLAGIRIGDIVNVTEKGPGPAGTSVRITLHRDGISKDIVLDRKPFTQNPAKRTEQLPDGSLMTTAALPHNEEIL